MEGLPLFGLSWDHDLQSFYEVRLVPVVMMLDCKI